MRFEKRGIHNMLLFWLQAPWSTNFHIKETVQVKGRTEWVITSDKSIHRLHILQESECNALQLHLKTQTQKKRSVYCILKHAESHRFLLFECTSFEWKFEGLDWSKTQMMMLTFSKNLKNFIRNPVIFSNFSQSDQAEATNCTLYDP